MWAEREDRKICKQKIIAYCLGLGLEMTLSHDTATSICELLSVIDLIDVWKSCNNYTAFKGCFGGCRVCILLHIFVDKTMQKIIYSEAASI